MSGGLQFLIELLRAVQKHLESAERARHDEMELKILRELLTELDKLIAPLVASAASEAAGISQATIEQVMGVMKRAVDALASYARDSMADYIEDKSQSNAAAVEASTRLYEALTVLLGVTGNQREWLDTRLRRPALSWLLRQPYRYVEPRDFAMQAIELGSTLNSVMLEAEHAQRDLTLAHHPSRYVLPAMSTALAPTTSKAQASPISEREMSRISKSIKELRDVYSSTLFFIEDFATQVKTRLEQHRRPAGGISAIIVRAQIALTISFCLQSRLVMEGISSAILAVGQNVVDADAT